MLPKDSWQVKASYNKPYASAFEEICTILRLLKWQINEKSQENGIIEAYRECSSNAKGSNISIFVREVEANTTEIIATASPYKPFYKGWKCVKDSLTALITGLGINKFVLEEITPDKQMSFNEVDEGTLLLTANFAKYYGGYKIPLNNGIWISNENEVTVDLRFTSNFIVVIKNAVLSKNRILLCRIPIHKIQDITISESDKTFIITYLDDYGIFQKPKFKISSLNVENKEIINYILQKPKIKDVSEIKLLITKLLEIGPNVEDKIKSLSTTQHTQHTDNKLEEKELCEKCHKSKILKLDMTDKLYCEKCFVEEYGRILLYAAGAEYYGGHKAFPAGRLFKDYEVGNLWLTEKYLIFRKGVLKKDWIIKIPLKRVQIENWKIDETARRTSIIGSGMSLPTIFGIGGIGGGVMHQEGKKHQLVIPYIDENGIPQMPRFGISSLTGKAIKKWASAIYEAIVKAKQEELQKSPIENKSQDVKPQLDININDPLTILKLRLAKGEITKEEYEELKKLLE